MKTNIIYSKPIQTETYEHKIDFSILRKKGNPMTSDELYSRCIQNDEEAWAYAYNYVCAFLKKTTGKYQDIEDLVHDTLHYFLDGGLEKLEKPHAFKKWLKMKSKGLFIDRYRYKTAHRHEPLEFEDNKSHSRKENPAIEPADPEVEDALFLKKAIPILQETLKAIGEECRNILERYFRGRFMGDKTKDMAEDLDLLGNTFRVKVHRCLKKLFRRPEYTALLEDYKVA